MRLWVEIRLMLSAEVLHKVSLLVRLWVEIYVPSHSTTVIFVSLLVRLWVEMSRCSSKASSIFLSASLWGCELKWKYYVSICCYSRQPPCEAVSWNMSSLEFNMIGVVSLLVRLWVEMYKRNNYFALCMSASLWGCELKCLRGNDLVTPVSVSLLVRLWVEMSRSYSYFLNSFVSLLVRLWVEIIDHSVRIYANPLSASLWGCELKY